MVGNTILKTPQIAVTSSRHIRISHQDYFALCVHVQYVPCTSFFFFILCRKVGYTYSLYQLRELVWWSTITLRVNRGSFMSGNSRIFQHSMGSFLRYQCRVSQFEAYASVSTGSKWIYTDNFFLYFEECWARLFSLSSFDQALWPPLCIYVLQPHFSAPFTFIEASFALQIRDKLWTSTFSVPRSWIANKLCMHILSTWTTGVLHTTCFVYC